MSFDSNVDSLKWYLSNDRNNGLGGVPIKIVSVMLLIIAFFLTAWYNDIKKSNNEVTQAIKKLTLETKLLQQMNKQFTNDIKVLYKRQNQLIDWKNKHDVLHASYQYLNTKK